MASTITIPSEGEYVTHKQIREGFQAAKTDIEALQGGSGILAAEIAIADAGTLFTAENVETALAETATALNVVEAALGNVTKLQVAGGTFASGTATINAGIVVTAATDAFIIMSAVITGSTNVGGVAHLKASNVVGGAGVGAVTLNVLTDAGVLDADAAGAFRVLLVN